jgi:hypothetical protein
MADRVGSIGARMDRSAVKEIVDREVESLRHRLGIEDWKIRVEYHAEGPDDDGGLSRAECTRLVDYGIACISINHEALEAEAEVIETIRHELFHVVLAPFDLHRSAVERMDFDDAKAARAVLSRVWDHSCERAVANLEKMYQRLSESPPCPMPTCLPRSSTTGSGCRMPST